MRKTSRRTLHGERGEKEEVIPRKPCMRRVGPLGDEHQREQQPTEEASPCLLEAEQKELPEERAQAA